MKHIRYRKVKFEKLSYRIQPQLFYFFPTSNRCFDWRPVRYKRLLLRWAKIAHSREIFYQPNPHTIWRLESTWESSSWSITRFHISYIVRIDKSIRYIFHIHRKFRLSNHQTYHVSPRLFVLASIKMKLEGSNIDFSPCSTQTVYISASYIQYFRSSTCFLL